MPGRECTLFYGHVMTFSKRKYVIIAVIACSCIINIILFMNINIDDVRKAFQQYHHSMLHSNTRSRTHIRIFQEGERNVRTLNKNAASSGETYLRKDLTKDKANVSISKNSDTHDVTKWKNDIASCVGQNTIRAGMHGKETASGILPLSKEASLALKLVMADIEKDKRETYDVDLRSPKDFSDVTFPLFLEWGKPGYMGENGTGVNDTWLRLTRNERKRKGKDFYIHHFNLWVSRSIPVHRSLYEARSLSCQSQHYNLSTTGTTPTISVIIVFYNEAWSTLLRTIHSVIDTSPKGAITEIVLLDDFSTRDNLKSPLEIYLRTQKFVVRLLRSTKRLGLIKARNLGFLHSEGEIVVFLDSHVECFPGWFQPLIAPIVLDPSIVTFPTIEIILPQQFKVIKTRYIHTGSLDVDTLMFSWRKVKDDGNTSHYYRSPTMPGGLYAVSRSWFYKMGGYDPGIQVWGGENIEFSFKTWMCGGSLLLSTCSHIGHVFGTSLPHDKQTRQRNRQRVAEVWMDEYKHFYYEKLAYHLVDPGNLTNQMRLRESLQCHDFRWYLDHVNHKLKEEMDPMGKYFGLIWKLTTGGHLVNGNNMLSVDTKSSVKFLRDNHKRVIRKLKEMRLLGNDRNQTPEMFLDYLTSCMITPSFNMTSHKLSSVSMTSSVTMATNNATSDKSSSQKMTSITMTTQSTPRPAPILLITSIPVNYVSQYSADFHYDKNQQLVHKDTSLCLTKNPVTPTIDLCACSNHNNQKWILQTRDQYRSLVLNPGT